MEVEKNLVDNAETIGSLKNKLTVTYSKLSDKSVRVTATLEVINTSAWNFTLRTSSPSYIEIDDTKTNQTSNVTVSSAGTRTVITATKDFTYSGSKDAITVSSFLNMQGNGVHHGTHTIYNSTLSLNLDMPTLNGVSVIKATDIDIGGNSYISIKKYVSSNTDTITWSFGDLSGTITNDSNSSFAYFDTSSIKDDLYARLTSAKYSYITLNCITKSYDNTTYSGTYQLKISCVESECKPEVNMTVKDVNSTTLALTGNNQKIVKGYSNVNCTVTRSAKKGATIKSTKITNNGVTVSSLNYTFRNAVNNIFEVTVTDSRGYSSTKRTVLTLIEYFTPTISSGAARNTNVDGNVKPELKGNFFNGSFGNVSNELKLEYFYKKAEDTEYTYGGELAETVNGNKYSYSTLIGGFNYKYSYDISFCVTDKLSSLDITKNIVAGEPVLGIGKNIIKAFKILRVMNGIKFGNDLNIGDNTHPIYWKDGKPVAISGLNNDLEVLREYKDITLSIGTGGTGYQEETISVSKNGYEVVSLGFYAFGTGASFCNVYRCTVDDTGENALIGVRNVNSSASVSCTFRLLLIYLKKGG